MKALKASYEIMNQDVSKNDSLELMDELQKFVEKVGRICYKSEDNITEDSYKKFFNRIKDSGHWAVIEHGSVYYMFPKYDEYAISWYDVLIDKQNAMPNMVKPIISTEDEENYYISTNLSYIFQIYDLYHNIKVDIDKYLVPFDPEYHERRISVKFITSLQVTTDLFRHRKMSYAQESTRYCNYSKDKFGNELSFIIPPYINLEPGHYDINSNIEGKWENMFVFSALQDEKNYLMATKELGMQAQQASIFLPKDLKTECVVTGFLSDWAYEFSLRALGTTGAPRPDVLELMVPLMNDFESYFEEWTKYSKSNAPYYSYNLIELFLKNKELKYLHDNTK